MRCWVGRGRGKEHSTILSRLPIISLCYCLINSQNPTIGDRSPSSQASTYPPLVHLGGKKNATDPILLYHLVNILIVKSHFFHSIYRVASTLTSQVASEGFLAVNIWCAVKSTKTSHMSGYWIEKSSIFLSMKNSLLLNSACSRGLFFVSDHEELATLNISCFCEIR